VNDEPYEPRDDDDDDDDDQPMQTHLDSATSARDNQVTLQYIHTLSQKRLYFHLTQLWKLENSLCNIVLKTMANFAAYLQQHCSRRMF